MPALAVLAWNLTLVAVSAEQLASPQFMWPRSTKRYSALALQFDANCHSMPPPAVQPTRVSVWPAKRGSAGSLTMRARTSPNATPPVTYGIQLPGAAQPNRPRTVPSQVFSVLQLKPVPPATTGPLQT